MNINLMPIDESELPIDIDVYVWLWNKTDNCWRRTTTWASNAFSKTYPNRYTHWVSDESITCPVIN